MSPIAVRVPFLRYVPRIIRRGYRFAETLGIAPAQMKRKVLFAMRKRLLPNRPIWVRVNEVAFKIVPKGALSAAVWSGERFDEHEMALVLRLLRPGMIFFDVGAGIGLYTLAAASKNPLIQVHAFESGGSTFEVLAENVRLNQLKNVKVHQGVATVDAFVSGQNIQRIDFMRIDVDGAERLVFQGAKTLLMGRDAPMLFFENDGKHTRRFGYHPVENLWLLKRRGYKLFVLDQSNRVLTREACHGYDARIFAAKPSHSLYEALLRNREGDFNP